MSKAETSRGNPNLPVGQSKRGFSADTTGNPKNPRNQMSIPTPTDNGVVTTTGGAPLNTSTAGFPGEESRNSVKDGDTWLPDDSKVNRGYAYVDDGQAVDTGGLTNPGANRQRFGIAPPTVPEPTNGIAWYDNSGNGPGGIGPAAQQQ